MTKVLLLGGGGREHALGWKLAAEGVELTSAPGNPGLAELGPTLAGVAIDQPGQVAAAAEGFDLVVVGPEAPLAAGVANALGGRGIPVFGPTRAAARLESSKAFAKQVMADDGVPTASAGAFTARADAIRHLDEAGPPYVVKADGLAAGKGVLVTDSRAEAVDWVDRCLAGGFGEAGRTVVIEEHLAGPEVSVFALCAGEQLVALDAARDYKRLGDADQGPNTGGMGAFSPVPDLPPARAAELADAVMRPVLSRLAAAGTPYRGFLYAGLVLTGDGPKVLEFNCRLGDPETQVVVPRLDAALADLLLAGAAGDLPDGPLDWSPNSAVDVVLAAPGYPEGAATGAVVDGVKEAADVPGVVVFHAGTARRPEGLVTAGGRVLNVVGTGPDLATARRRAYEAAELIRFEGKQWRSDIAVEGGQA